jgi:hypothetical protein
MSIEEKSTSIEETAPRGTTRAGHDTPSESAPSAGPRVGQGRDGGAEGGVRAWGVETPARRPAGLLRKNTGLDRQAVEAVDALERALVRRMVDARRLLGRVDLADTSRSDNGPDSLLKRGM